MAMKKIHFGTDGWRAEIARDFTFDNVRKVAQAIADYVNHKAADICYRLSTIDYRPRTEHKRLIVGYDRRFLSDEYARLVSEVLAANNIRVFLTEKATPTPAISFSIKNKRLNGGVIITASHNPPQFNGIKFKTHHAAPADEKTTKNIENLIGKNRIRLLDFDSAVKTKRIELIDASKDYIKFIRRYIDLKSINRMKPKILVDYMHGAGAEYLEAILKKASCNVEAIRDSVNPLFGGVNPEPIPKNLGASLDRLKTKKYDLAVALDGDADRIGAISPDGKYITSGQIVSLILLHFLEDKKLSGAVAKTISGTILLEKICDRFSLRLFETPVGFKHISQLMLNENILIGGEESGGIGFCNYIPERDGILSALLLIEMLAQKKKSIISIMNEIDKTYGRFCYDRIDVEYPSEKAARLTSRLKKNPPSKIAGKRVIKMKTYDGIKFILDDDSWLLLRFSGTEPLIRLYAEAHSDKGVCKLLDAAKRIIKT